MWLIFWLTCHLLEVDFCHQRGMWSLLSSYIICRVSKLVSDITNYINDYVWSDWWRHQVDVPCHRSQQIVFNGITTSTAHCSSRRLGTTNTVSNVVLYTAEDRGVSRTENVRLSACIMVRNGRQSLDECSFRQNLVKTQITCMAWFQIATTSIWHLHRDDCCSSHWWHMSGRCESLEAGTRYYGCRTIIRVISAYLMNAFNHS